jgi:hypothetical protein
VRHCATSRKVAVSTPDGFLRFFIDLIVAAAFMALGLTQPVTEMNARDLPGGGAKEAGA